MTDTLHDLVARRVELVVVTSPSWLTTISCYTSMSSLRSLYPSQTVHREGCLRPWDSCRSYCSPWDLWPACQQTDTVHVIYWSRFYTFYSTKRNICRPLIKETDCHSGNTSCYQSSIRCSQWPRRINDELLAFADTLQTLPQSDVMTHWPVVATDQLSLIIHHIQPSFACRGCRGLAFRDVPIERLETTCTTGSQSPDRSEEIHTSRATVYCSKEYHQDTRQLYSVWTMSIHQ